MAVTVSIDDIKRVYKAFEELAVEEYRELDVYKRQYLQGAFDEYPLWIRDVYLWPALTLPGRDWTFWQYSDKGRLVGYQGEEVYKRQVCLW